jgi:hypothetical protein
MKNLLFPISLLLILAFANCKTNKKHTNNQDLELKKGLVINSSVTFKNVVGQVGQGHALALRDYEKIITIEGDSLTIDFNHIELIGTDDFTKPDKFKGIAIHIKNSNFVTIKNLNVSGFRIALQADNVQDLTIDSCDFTYNYRADSSANFDINKVKEGAIVLNNSKNIIITNSTISHNYNGLVLNNSDVKKLKDCAIQFNSKVGLYFNNSTAKEIYLNKIDWNLVAGNWHSDKIRVTDLFGNSMTHNGMVQLGKLDRFMNNIKYSKLITNEILDSFTIKLFHIEAASERSLSPKLDPKYPTGEAYKLPTKYGVYDFEYPAIFYRTCPCAVESKARACPCPTFAMFGPLIGNWKFVNSENVRSTNSKTGSFPATFIIEKEDPEKPFSLAFEFIGERFQDEFGIWKEKGKIYKFGNK